MATPVLRKSLAAYLSKSAESKVQKKIGMENFPFQKKIGMEKLEGFIGENPMSIADDLVFIQGQKAQEQAIIREKIKEC